MNTVSEQRPQAFPMHELDQIEQALGAIDQWRSTLAQRREVLMRQLDAATRPTPTPPAAVQRLIPRGCEYLGRHEPCWTYIDIHTSLLGRLWRDFPERRDAMAEAMARCGASRNYVATSPQSLFPGRSLQWAQRYCRRLVDGWYVDTNLNAERMRRILPVAIAAAGLAWGKDVKIHWRTTVSHA